MKTRILSIVMLAITTLTSCIHEFPVTDHSFDFAGEIIYDADSDQHRLTLTCKKKSGAEEYDIVFHVDGENVITLTDMEGTTHQDWFTESFSETDSHTYILSEAAVGMHKVEMTISTEEFCQSIEIEYEVLKQKYEIHSEVSTVGAGASSLLLSLADGDPKYIYMVKVCIDSTILSEREIDFSDTPICTISLPGTLRPGNRSLTVDVSDGMTPKSYAVSFVEPVRHPQLQVTLKHDDDSGYHIAMIGDNPYGIQLDFAVSLELKGMSSFYHEEEDYWWRTPEYKYLTETDKQTISTFGTNTSVNLTDRDGIAKKITSQWETSYIWASVSTPGGGEDSGNDYTYISGSTPSFYQIYQEKLSITVNGEAISGVTLKITNEIGKMTLNDKESISGTISITL